MAPLIASVGTASEVALKGAIAHLVEQVLPCLDAISIDAYCSNRTPNAARCLACNLECDVGLHGCVCDNAW